jgi:cell wall-associated NlpC family hydrolase
MKNILPYLGLQWTPEFNCWGLTRYFFEKEHGIQLEEHAVSVFNTVAERIDIRTGEEAKNTWIRTAGPTEDGVVLLGSGETGYHIGVLVTATQVLHLTSNASSNVSPLANLVRTFKHAAFYSHAQLRNRI